MENVESKEMYKVQPKIHGENEKWYYLICPQGNVVSSVNSINRKQVEYLVNTARMLNLTMKVG